jgi:asparagine synthase (glutamine-hydrolysing)
MCGIAGSFSLNGFFSEADIAKASKMIAHRGPDGSGIYADEKVVLAHRRLSIIDLDARASQPMLSHNKRYVMSYNGEVYNYIELREQLQRNFSGTPLAEFKTTSDSEVILKLFEAYGVGFVTHLNGMFAIAIYDTLEQKLFLFRDRFGIKPLFYYVDDNGSFCFASELKALLAISKISKEVNHQAILYFLQSGFVPAPHTIFSKISKLESGSTLVFDGLKPSVSSFWQHRNCNKSEQITDEGIMLHKLDELLNEAVRLQLRCDVPYGVFLSGGVDSSLITAIAARHVSQPLNTFSIGFHEQTHDESEYAKAVAKTIGTHHHEFKVAIRDAINLIDTFFETYDEPYADTSGIPTMLVSALAAKQVKVVLAGDGGDELFFGYGTHNWAKRLSQFPFRHLRKPFKSALPYFGSRYSRIAHLLNFSRTKDFLPAHIHSQEQYLFSHSEMNDLLLDSFYQKTKNNLGLRNRQLNEWFNSDKQCSPEELQSLYELKFPFQDDLLTKVDRASMLYALETRVPYLDNILVEYSFNIPTHLKIKNGINKYPLKKVLSAYIPESLFMRPKRGFSIPLAKWLKSDWKYLIEQYLSEETIHQAGIVKYDYVKSLLKQFFSGQEYMYNRIWCLIVLHRWYRHHFL